MRNKPRWPEAFDERVERMGFWTTKHPSLHGCVVTEAELILHGWYGSRWRAGWALIWQHVAARWSLRVYWPVRRLLHPLGWHDHYSLDDGCMMCEVERDQEGA